MRSSTSKSGRVVNFKTGRRANQLSYSLLCPACPSMDFFFPDTGRCLDEWSKNIYIFPINMYEKLCCVFFAIYTFHIF